MGYKGYCRNFHEAKLKKLIDQVFMLNFGRIYDYEKQKRIGKMEKNKKKSRKNQILILFLENYWSGSDLAKDLGDLRYFRDLHVFRNKSNFLGEWFVPKSLYMYFAYVEHDSHEIG